MPLRPVARLSRPLSPPTRNARRVAASSNRPPSVRSLLSLSLLGSLLIALCSCDRFRGPRTAFSGESTLGYVKTQLDFGPRVPGTPGHRRTGDWIVAGSCVFTDGGHRRRPFGTCDVNGVGAAKAVTTTCCEMAEALVGVR